MWCDGGNRSSGTWDGAVVLVRNLGHGRIITQSLRWALGWLKLEWPFVLCWRLVLLSILLVLRCRAVLQFWRPREYIVVQWSEVLVIDITKLALLLPLLLLKTSRYSWE